MKTNVFTLTLFNLVLFFSQGYAQNNSQGDTCIHCLSDARLEKIIKEEDNNGFSIQVLGNGNIQSSFESGEDIPANTGVGVSVTKYFFKEQNDKILSDPFRLLGIPFYRITLDASINVASTIDTLVAETGDNAMIENQSDFGSSILTPLNSGQAVEVEFTGLFQETYGGILSGLNVNYIGSNRNWTISDSVGSYTQQVSTTMLRVGLFHDFVRAEHRDDYSAALGVAVGYNRISGDIGLPKNDDLRESVLGTTDLFYPAGELSLSFRLKNVKANFAYTLIPGSESVSGLSGGRIITSISFIGGFGLDIKD